MPISRPLQLAVLSASLLVGALRAEAGETAVEAPPFPHQHSDLSPDPLASWGVLGNGMRYCVMANQQPKDKVSLRLLVESGSLLETAPQRGLAHFLEHLAFNGTAHYPPGTLVGVLQGLGLAFGADTNAHTSFDETVYKLDLPDTKDATIATGLQVMADYAGAMLIAPAEVERERGVILAEMRDRDTPGLRQWQTLYRANYPGLLLPERFPIGTRETVTQGTPALLKDYYDHWYRPERMMLAVVGAIEPAAIAQQLRSSFSGLAPRAAAEPAPALGTPAADGFTAVYHREAEADGTMLSLMRVVARPHPHDSAALRREYQLQSLGERILGRRFHELIAKDPQGPLIEAGAESYQWMDLFHAGIEAKLRPGGAFAAVAVVEQELRRMLEHGPTAGELAVARSELGAALDEAVARAANRTNAALADALYRSVHDDTVLLSPLQERALLKPLLDQATPAEVARAMADEWRRGHLALVVTGADDLGADAEQRLAAAYAASQRVVVAPPAQRQALAWAYGAAPAPGGWLAAPAAPGAAGVVAATLANQVQVRVKRTGFKPNEVMVQVRIAVPPAPNQPGLREFAERAFLAGALGKHSAQDLDEVLAGSTVHLTGPRFDEDGMAFTAVCLPSELELCFQELRAYLTDPGWRGDGEATAKAAWIEQLKSIATSLDAQVGRTFQALAVSDAPQRRSATLDEAQAVGFAQVRPWLEPYLREAPLALNVDGDVGVEAVAALAATYFGSLPTRQAVTVALRPDPATGRIDTAALAASPTLPAGLHRIAVPGTVARALIDIAWPTGDMYDIGRTRRLGLLAGAIDERMRVRIRQELGDAYSPFAYRVASDAYRDFGYIVAQVGVAPEKAEEARTTLLAIAQDLADQGVSEALLAQVKTPIIKNLAAQRQQNQYWLGAVLARSAWQPFRLEWAEGMEADYAAITAAELGALAKQYLINAKTLQVVGVCSGATAK
jgi:zinc protease